MALTFGSGICIGIGISIGSGICIGIVIGIGIGIGIGTIFRFRVGTWHWYSGPIDMDSRLWALGLGKLRLHLHLDFVRNRISIGNLNRIRP